MASPPSELQPATLSFQDGVPFSPEYGDIYYTRAGGLDQAKTVFLSGNDLPQRWKDQAQFTVLETGFGLGLNFLATWAAWATDPQACERLHFLSVEKHPLSLKDLEKAHAIWPELAVFSAELRSHWPPCLPGFHRIFLAGGRVILTLIWGDATHCLRQISARVDAFFLDGFSPAKNPALWSPEIAQALARLAAAGATLATWSVSSAVCAALTAAGFELEKAPGFGGKRHRLTGRFRHRPPLRQTIPETRTALVIGAGIAGSSIAERLAFRGWKVTVLDAHPSAGQGASGNLAGVFRPLPSVDDNLLARLTRAGFLFLQQHLQHLESLGQTILWNSCGALHLAQDEEDFLRQAKALKTLRAPPEFLQLWDAQTARAALGLSLQEGGWFFPQGGWVQPFSVCAANLLAWPSRITTHWNTVVSELRPIPKGQGWQVLGPTGTVLAEASIAVMAAGVGATHFPAFRDLPQRAVRGQVSHLPATALSHSLPYLVCGHGYLTPCVSDTQGHPIHVLGASTVPDDLEDTCRSAEHAENLDRLNSLLPGLLAKPITDLSALPGRVGFRPASQDRFPIVGTVPETGWNMTPNQRPSALPGLWCIQGFGARGIVWSALMAELLACQIQGEPLPLPSDLARAVSSLRSFCAKTR